MGGHAYRAQVSNPSIYLPLKTWAPIPTYLLPSMIAVREKCAALHSAARFRIGLCFSLVRPPPLCPLLVCCMKGSREAEHKVEEKGEKQQLINDYANNSNPEPPLPWAALKGLAFVSHACEEGSRPMHVMKTSENHDLRK